MLSHEPLLSAALNSVSLEEVKKEMGPPNWNRHVVSLDHIRGVIICQNSGTVNDNHCHNYDEWWVILEGEIDWVIEGREDNPVQAKAGDFVFVPALTFHHIFPKGGKPSIRLGMALPGQGHVHERPKRKIKISMEE